MGVAHAAGFRAPLPARSALPGLQTTDQAVQSSATPNGDLCSSRGFCPRRSGPFLRAGAAQTIGEAVDQPAMQATALQRPSSGSVTWGSPLGHYASLLFALYRSHMAGELRRPARKASRFHAMPAAPQLPPPPHVGAPCNAAAVAPRRRCRAGRAGAHARCAVPGASRAACRLMWSGCPACTARQQRHSAPITDSTCLPRLPAHCSWRATCAPTRPRTAASWRATRARSCRTPCPAGW